MTNAESADARPYHHGDLRRALIEAALALVKEEQDWAFSLREVARRAGVSHNAPYNHFPEKRDLLAAVAAAGFETLRERMLAATVGIRSPRTALIACARAYVQAGVENPALFRLMFGPVLVTIAAGRPAEARDAGARAKAVLDEIILRGAQSGDFATSPDGKSELAMASLSVWSAVHGLTMLALDKLTGSDLSIDNLVKRLMRTLFDGLMPRSSRVAVPQGAD
jgi:AcrR family transcriptional regulator